MNDFFASDVTAALGEAAATRRDIGKTRGAIGNRLFGTEWESNTETSGLRPAQAAMWDALNTAFDKSTGELGRLLRQHELWPFLEPLKGLGGIQVAILLAKIRHPHRFPGQPCSEGHIFVPGLDVGSPCPAVGFDEDSETRCTGTMRPPREGAGVRSLWHYTGLSVGVDGRALHHERGRQGDWNPQARAALLMPTGIADQIVRQRTPKYRDVYDTTKVRIASERPTFETMKDAKASGELMAVWPGKVDTIARYVAVKAFVGDLLVEWKSIVPLSMSDMAA